jgi:two-component system, response regulator RegA
MKSFSAQPPTVQPTLLLVDDDLDLRESLRLEFSERGYDVWEAGNPTEVIELASLTVFRFALLDLRLQADNGLDIIPLLLEKNPRCRIVILTGYGSIPTAVEAVKRGAINYLTKPAPIERIEKALWIDPTDTPEITEHDLESLERHEQEYLEYVLLQCQGNISQAARWLGIHRQSLQRKLKRIGLK